MAVAVGIAVVLFFTGAFNRKAPTPVAALPAAVPPAGDIAATQGGDTEARSITPPAQGETTDVPKARVAVAPAALGEPPVRSTHGDWQIRCDTPAGAQS